MIKRMQFTLSALPLTFLVLSTTLQAASPEAKGEQQELMDFFASDKSIIFPQPAPLMTNVYGRKTKSLNGNWEIIVDEAGFGFRNVMRHRFIADKKPLPTGMELIESSFDKRKTLKVPGDWNSQDPKLDRYRGKVLYHKLVAIDKKKDKRYLIHFGGSNYVTDLFVNSKLVGRHIGGYTSFNFDITDFITAGENTIIARVDAFLDDSTIPTMRTSDFWKYGGITRDVQLVEVPENYISQYHVYLSDRETGEIRGWVQLNRELANQQINLRIPKLDVKLSAKTNAKGKAEFVARVKNLSLWSPDNPGLYTVKIASGESKLQDKIGFRSISVQGKQILLNGEPVKLYGISMHEETPLREGVANTRKDAEVQLGLIKELGANFVRLAHYPHNEYTVKLADELGLMVWSEIPIVSLIDWENEETLAAATTQITDNLLRDLNRASIVMWSISNETFPKTEPRLNFLKSLASTVKTLDDSKRPVTSALIGNFTEEFEHVSARLVHELARSTMLDEPTRSTFAEKAAQMPSHTAHGDINVTIDDPLGEVVDIVGYNEYFGWYYSSFLAPQFKVGEDVIRAAMFNIMPDIRFNNVFGKPMIISEFGAGAKKGFYSTEALIWSEEYQSKVYKAQLSMLEKSDFVQGISPWVLKDFRSQMRHLNGIQETYNRKGLISESGEKKLAFEVLKDYYHQQQ